MTYTLTEIIEIVLLFGAIIFLYVNLQIKDIRTCYNHKYSIGNDQYRLANRFCSVKKPRAHAFPLRVFLRKIFQGVVKRGPIKSL